MSRFIKLMDSPETKELMKDHHSFILFSQIALRARREPGIVYNGNIQTQLEAGQALTGDYESIGLTRQQYRTSIKRLLDNHLITIKTTNRGSIATLINTSIYDINLQDDNHQNNQDLTNKQPSANHQLTTNKNVKKEKNLRIEENTPLTPQGETVSVFVCPEFLKDLWPDYLITRRQRRAARTDSALQRIVDKLEALAPGDHESQHRILQKSIDSGWTDVYQLKDEDNGMAGLFKDYKFQTSTAHKETEPLPKIELGPAATPEEVSKIMEPLREKFGWKRSAYRERQEINQFPEQAELEQLQGDPAEEPGDCYGLDAVCRDQENIC